MISKDRLERSNYGRGLLAFISRMTLFYVTDWGNNDSQTKSDNRPGDRHEVKTGMNNANVVTSLHSADSTRAGRHALVLDIDHPTWLVPSTTPGHFHLYVDVPSGIETSDYEAILNALAVGGVIEWGYAGASKARGFTSVRLPWVEKMKGPIQHD